MLHVFVSTLYGQSFDFSHSSRCAVIPQCSLICSSLITNDVEYLFMCHNILTFLVEVSVQIFCPFLKTEFSLSVSFESSLYILDTSCFPDNYCKPLPFHSLNSLSCKVKTFLATSSSVQNPSFLTRDQTCTPCIGSSES